MKITFEETQIEVGTSVRGRPSYRWVRALYVIRDGVRIYPPMRVREARRFAKELQLENSKS